MNETILLLDCHYLCNRAFHTTGDLSHEGIRTGVIYGFLRDIIELEERFDTDRIVFAFDVGHSAVRKALYAGYKAHRRADDATPEEREAWADLDRQIALLRRKYLPAIGFRNILWQKGYESDDIIASLVRHNLGEGDTAVIVTADKDMHQLISHNVMLYDPRTGQRKTLQSFHKEYGIKPKQWADVLTLAGCSTDEVPGISGVGVTTALKYLKGELPAHHKTHQAIVANQDGPVCKLSRKLTKLPLKGTKDFHLYNDVVSRDKWAAVLRKLGIRSFDGSPRPWVQKSYTHDGQTKPIVRGEKRHATHGGLID